MVILEDLGKSSLEALTHTENLAEYIQQQLAQPYPLRQHLYYNSPSIGATLFNDHAQSVDELLKQADIAMYQAKKAGRNTLRFFDPAMQETINARAALEAALRQALAEEGLQLYYQVQMDEHCRPIGAEVLIRWSHPERGLISPGDFIPLAEETDLILPIGQWVLEQACQELARWSQRPETRDLKLAVNVSAKQFRRPDFVAQVQAAVTRHDIDATRLKLELTESMLLENMEQTIATMRALRAIGVKLSLDDFGTGYSSLQYLKHLPLDQIKIDQSFVRDLVSNPSDLAIVRTIIAMADGLHLNVIAEGVETNEQRDTLLELG